MFYWLRVKSNSKAWKRLRNSDPKVKNKNTFEAWNQENQGHFKDLTVYKNIKFFFKVLINEQFVILCASVF